MTTTMNTLCKCGYSWKSRVTCPKACPECKRRLIIKPVAQPTYSNKFVPAGTKTSQSQENLPEDQLIFAEQAAQKLKFLKDNEWDEKIAQLYAYCEEIGYTKEAAELAVKRAKDLKRRYAQANKTETKI